MSTDDRAPLATSDFVRRQEATGVWRQQKLAAAIVGLTRDIVVYRAKRTTNLITFKKHGDRDTYCPPLWWDLGIGSGACGLGCRACFLMLTFRMMRDPLKHVLYDNVEEFWIAVEKWLRSPVRRQQCRLSCRRLHRRWSRSNIQGSCTVRSQFGICMGRIGRCC